MRFNIIYRETIEDIKSGKYGEEWKALALSEKYVAVDAELHLYVCNKCGHWANEMGLSLYAPNDVRKLEEKHGEKKLEQNEIYPVFISKARKKEMMKDEFEKDILNWIYKETIVLNDDYHLLKRRIHKCEKCGGRMHKATNKEKYNLHCPYCGGAPKEDSIFYIQWD